MRWYDAFALTYDRQLEKLYAPYRGLAVQALAPAPGDAVLDLACGTGQSFPAIEASVGPSGRVIGIDRSAGMLRRAGRRADAAGWSNVTLIEVDAAEVGEVDLGVAEVDGLIIALGLTAMDDWRVVLDRALARLRQGGRCVILDVYSERRTLQTRLVELLARADLGRPVWEPLQAACPDFVRTDTGAPERTFGGTLYVASGTLRGSEVVG